MPVSHQHRPAGPSAYTPPSQIATQIIDLGTIDRAPDRESAPVVEAASRGSSLEIAIGLAVFGVIGTIGLAAGGLIIGAATLTYLNTYPDMDAATLTAAGTPGAGQAVDAAAAPEVTSAAAAPVASRSRSSSASGQVPPPIAVGDDEQEMSMTQLRSYLAGRSEAQEALVAPAYQAPAYQAPAPKAPKAMTTPPRRRATKKSAPDRASEDLDFDVDPLTAAAPAAAPMAIANSGSRLTRTSSGVTVLDDPLDAVAIKIATDGPARVTIDGQFVGAVPLSVVLEEGGHSVIIDSDKGQDTFNLDAYSGENWCFSVRKGPKSVACNKL